MDLDGDGIPDLISGSWPGEIFFFKGRGKGRFDAPVMLRDKDGNIINIGGGIRHEADGSILITGNGEWETTKEGSFVTYHGQRFKSTAEKPIATTGTASAVHVVDWNGDGLPDLLVGDIRGHVYLVPNEGTRTKYAFGKPRQLMVGGKAATVSGTGGLGLLGQAAARLAGAKPVEAPGGDAGPFACDWDGDGKLDLLLGAGDGSVWFYRNIGTAKEPVLAEGVRLIPPGEDNFGPDAPREPRRGIRAKVCAVDWNGDGRLDLLVGDCTTQRPDRPAPTAAEKAEQDKAREELRKYQRRFGKLFGKLYGASRVKTDAELDKVMKEVKEIKEKMKELQAKLPAEYETHGWVWLYLRKSAEKTSRR